MVSIGNVTQEFVAYLFLGVNPFIQPTQNDVLFAGEDYIIQVNQAHGVHNLILIAFIVAISRRWKYQPDSSGVHTGFFFHQYHS